MLEHGYFFAFFDSFSDLVSAIQEQERKENVKSTDIKTVFLNDFIQNKLPQFIHTVQTETVLFRVSY